MIMKRIIYFILFAIVASFSMPQVSCAQSKQLQKQRTQMYKKKTKELKREGWTIDSNLKTLEVALLEHYEMLNDPNNLQIVGHATNTKTINVSRQVASNNALIEYANLAATTLKGRIESDVFSDASDEEARAEFDKLYAAYERLVKTEISSGTLRESLSLKKKEGNTYEYQIFYIVNEDKASQARRRAIERAFEETQVAQKYATKVSQFVNEAFPLDNE